MLQTDIRRGIRKNEIILADDEEIVKMRFIIKMYGEYEPLAEKY